ncbi:MAG: hypothetical protein KZQ83_00285 [gamma proteobacterium symbiont of Taylorina sp.]|nr:hypothetical protein [gamma proteobacterium symbiont of Taylorina sp.]
MKLQNNKYVQLFFMSCVIILAMTFVLDFADFLDDHSENVVKLGINPQCNAARAICSASIMNEGNFQRISFTIKKSVSNIKELDMMSTVSGFDLEGIESVAVLFETLDKEGDSPVILLTPDKTSHQIVPEKWHAVAQLAAIEDKNARKTDMSSDWRVIVRLQSSKKEYRAEFPFQF